MKRALIRSTFLLMSALLMGSLVGPTTAMAETPWRTMHPGANPPGIAGAKAQCERAGESATTCNELARQLDAGQCQQVTNTYGTRYQWLGGRGGKIAADMVNQLKGSPPALRCNVNGRLFDWYTGFDGACNNLGRVKTEYTLSRSTSSSIRPGYVVESPGLFVPGSDCCNDCGNNDVYIPGTRVFVPASNNSSIRLN